MSYFSRNRAAIQKMCEPIKGQEIDMAKLFVVKEDKPAETTAAPAAATPAPAATDAPAAPTAPVEIEKALAEKSENDLKAAMDKPDCSPEQKKKLQAALDAKKKGK